MVEDDFEEATLLAATHRSPSPLPEAPSEMDELERLFREHHRKVFQAAYRITGNPSDAEDVLQTVFLRLLRREARVSLSGNVAGYLHIAAVNGALDLMRSRTAARSCSLTNLETALPDPDGNGPESAERDRETRQRVREALGRLSPRAAQIFVLRYFEGYGNREIARMLNTSQTFIAVMLHRARARLRKEIGPRAGGRQ